MLIALEVAIITIHILPMKSLMQREFKYVGYVIELLNRRDGIFKNGATKIMLSTIKMPTFQSILTPTLNFLVAWFSHP